MVYLMNLMAEHKHCFSQLLFRKYSRIQTYVKNIISLASENNNLFLYPKYLFRGPVFYDMSKKPKYLEKRSWKLRC